MGSAFIKTDSWDQLFKTRFFFIIRKEEYVQDSNGKGQTYVFWQPSNSSIRLDHFQIKDNKKTIKLAIIDNAINQTIEEEKSYPNQTKFSFHLVSDGNKMDYSLLLQSMCYRLQGGKDKLYFLYLVWFLGNEDWSSSMLKDAINNYDSQYLPFFLNHFQAICRCLSNRDQEKIKAVFDGFNLSYQVYNPSFIDEALYILSPESSPKISSMSIFDKIDSIILADEIETESDNQFILFKNWLSGKDVKIENVFLENFYSLLSRRTQLLVIKRYFHDVRNGVRNFDPSLLQKLKDNQFLLWEYLRHAIKSPNGKINIGNALLIDLILTLVKSQGNTFLSFDNVLDMAIQRSDVVDPSINTGLHSFLEACDGGAKVNEKFLGFIDYSIVYEIDNEGLTDEILLSAINNTLNRYARRKEYYVCGHSGQNDILPPEQIEFCRSPKYLNGHMPDCAFLKYYSDTWICHRKDYSWLNIFLENNLPTPNEKQGYEEIEITPKLFSIAKYREFIKGIAASCPHDGNNIVLKSCEHFDNNINYILQFYSFIRPKRMRIHPMKDTYLGISFDIFGIAKKLRDEKIPGLKNDISIVEANKRIQNDFIPLEKEKVYANLIQVLTEELDSEILEAGYFELEYNSSKLDKLLKQFYSSNRPTCNREEKNANFMEKGFVGKYALFCAPTKADKCNRAIGIPFFWCNGKECFHNALGNALLESCSDWRNYQLYHLIEIIGFPKIAKTDAGNEPDKIFRTLIATVNKAIKKFDRLKCRTCGHLMFPREEETFNKKNMYHCINPLCAEYNKDVYLNYCFKCKKGLIDSRDSKKCPNGSYICQDCISCCDDDYYEFLAQRHITAGMPIPWYIEGRRGQGHNDKDMFFCPDCGAQLYRSKDPETLSKLVCPNCHKEYSREGPVIEDWRPKFNDTKS